MAVLVVTFVVLVAAMLIYLAYNLLAEDVPQIQPAAIPPSQTREPPSPASTALRLNEEDWQGLCTVWQSICERYPREPKVALLYADLVISDLVRDRANAPQNEAMAPPSGDAITEQYRAAHDIVSYGRSRMLNPSEFDHAMDLYKNLFEELCAMGELPGHLSGGR